MAKKGPHASCRWNTYCKLGVQQTALVRHRLQSDLGGTRSGPATYYRRRKAEGRGDAAWHCPLVVLQVYPLSHWLSVVQVSLHALLTQAWPVAQSAAVEQLVAEELPENMKYRMMSTRTTRSPHIRGDDCITSGTCDRAGGCIPLREIVADSQKFTRPARGLPEFY